MEASRGCVFSIIIPVLHEAETINPLLEHLRTQQDRHRIEIIVVDGAPEQDTLRAITCRDVVSLAADTGRAVQMNAGAACARGDILIFLHADTCLPQHACRLIQEALARERCSAGAFNLGIRSDRIALKLIAAAASWRSRLTRIPYGDQAIFMKRDFFVKLGGYCALPLLEDIELMRRIKKRGDRICILSEKATTSPRRWLHEGIVYCTLRNGLLAFLYYAGCSPHMLARFYKNFRNPFSR